MGRRKVVVVKPRKELRETIDLIERKKWDRIKNLTWCDLIFLADFPTTARKITKKFKIQHVPFDPDFKLFKHQETVFTWMQKRVHSEIKYGVRGGIVQLDMGLGKTLMSLAFVLSQPHSEDSPPLIVASKTVMTLVWKKEIDQHLPGLRVLYLHKDYLGPKEISALNRDEIAKYDLVLTTYDVCLRCNPKRKFSNQSTVYAEHMGRQIIETIDKRTRKHADTSRTKGLQIIYGVYWPFVFFDESQRFANPDTAIYAAVMGVAAKWIWCLSGTPIKNYHTDIWAQLRVMGYNGCMKKKEWKARGLTFFRDHELRSCVYSMNYKDAGVEMPVKTERTQYVKLEGNFREVYNVLLKIIKKAIDKYLSRLVNFDCILALLAIMRQCLIAPYLITPDARKGSTKQFNPKKIKTQQTLAEQGLSTDDALGIWCHNIEDAGWNAPKIVRCIDIIKRVFSLKKKVVVFSTSKKCIVMLKKRILKLFPNTPFEVIDGDASLDERKDSVANFQSHPSTRLLLATYQVCSEGISLVAAEYVVCIDYWWNNAMPEQAKYRVWRIGQTKPVTVYNLFALDTLDTRIREICAHKEELKTDYLDDTRRKKPTPDSSKIVKLIQTL